MSERNNRAGKPTVYRRAASAETLTEIPDQISDTAVSESNKKELSLFDDTAEELLQIRRRKRNSRIQKTSLSVVNTEAKPEKAENNVYNSISTVKSGAAESLQDPITPVPDEDEDGQLTEIKELDVLKKLKEFNRETGRDRGEEQNDRDFVFDADSDEDEDESLEGMHFVKGSEQEEREPENDYSDAEENEESVKDNKSGVQKHLPARSQGNIGSFIRAANREPMLTEEEEHSLAEKLKNTGDISAARRLVMSHLRLVVSVARGYTGYGLPLADLIQEGNIGLMKAVKHFDPDMGGRLASFAVQWIKAEIHDYVIRNWRVVKVATTKAQRKLFFKLRQNKKRLGWFTENERAAVANDLGVSPDDVAEMETRLAGTDIGFDPDEDESSERGVNLPMSPGLYLEDENSDFAAHYESTDYESWENRKLKEALDSLDERSRHIVKRRWLDENKATLQELSKELKVSIERVRQIESNALNKLKSRLTSEGLKDSEVTEIKQLTDKSRSAALAVSKSRSLVVTKQVHRSRKKTEKAETPAVIIAAAPKKHKS